MSIGWVQNSTKRILFFVVAVALFFSCKTTKLPLVGNLNPMSAKEIIHNSEQNTIDYNYLSIKKINCQYADNKRSLSFRASISAIRNEQIMISATKFGFPIARLLLTPDSVQFINYFEQTYLVDDYSAFSSAFRMDLDFATIQAILSNRIFTHQNKSSLRKLKPSIEKGMYVLSTRRKVNPMQKTFFRPVQFLLSRLLVEDAENQHKLDVNFDDFISIEEKMYPSLIKVNYQSNKKEIDIKANMARFSIEPFNKRTIKIPQSYESIKLKK